jgi:hypothetical protein
MKGRLLSMGMLAGLLTFALVMIGCDHNPRPWNGEAGGHVDKAIVGDWWYLSGTSSTGTLSMTAGGEIRENNKLLYTFTAQGNIIMVNMEGQIIKGGYLITGDEGGTLSITGIEEAPDHLYKIPPK